MIQIEIIAHKLDIIIKGKFKSFNHSNKKSEDDTHEVKKQIFKKVGGRNYSNKVGNNPDLDINKNKKIVLVGVGERYKGKKLETEIDAVDFFEEIKHLIKLDSLPDKFDISDITNRIIDFICERGIECYEIAEGTDFSKISEDHYIIATIEVVASS